MPGTRLTWLGVASCIKPLGPENLLDLFPSDLVVCLCVDPEPFQGREVEGTCSQVRLLMREAARILPNLKITSNVKDE